MTLTQKVFALKSIEPFNKLSDSEIVLLANILQVKKYKDETVIYSKQNSLYNLYIIVDGKVVDDEEKEVDNYFGLKELLNDEVIDKNFYAKNDVTLFLISKAHLLTLLYESPSLMIGFLANK